MHVGITTEVSQATLNNEVLNGTLWSVAIAWLPTDYLTQLQIQVSSEEPRPSQRSNFLRSSKHPDLGVPTALTEAIPLPAEPEVVMETELVHTAAAILFMLSQTSAKLCAGSSNTPLGLAGDRPTRPKLRTIHSGRFPSCCRGFRPSRYR